MTQSTDQSTARSAHELEKLARALQRARRFALYFVHGRGPIAPADLPARIEQASGRPVTRVEIPDDIDDPLTAVQAAAEGLPAVAVLLVTGIERRLSSAEDERTLITLNQLNWQRTAYQRIERPVIFWTPEYVLRLLATHAPDFFTWNSGTYQLEGPSLVNLTQPFDPSQWDDHGSLDAADRGKRIAILERLIAGYTGDSPTERRARVAMLFRLGQLLASTGDYHRAQAVFEESLAISREIGDRQAEGEALGNLGVALLNLGDFRRAIQNFEQSLAVAVQTGNRVGQAAALGNLGVAYFRLGDLNSAIERYEQQVPITRSVGDRASECVVLRNIGNAYTAQGQVHRAIEYYEQSLDIARKLDDRRSIGEALGSLGIAYRNLGETRRAIELFEQHLDIARELGDRKGEAAALGNIGNAYTDSGQSNQAVKFIEQQLAISRQIGDRSSEGTALGNLGNAYLTSGDSYFALRLYEQRLARIIHLAPPDRRIG